MIGRDSCPLAVLSSAFLSLDYLHRCKREEL